MLLDKLYKSKTIDGLVEVLDVLAEEVWSRCSNWHRYREDCKDEHMKDISYYYETEAKQLLALIESEFADAKNWRRAQKGFDDREYRPTSHYDQLVVRDREQESDLAQGPQAPPTVGVISYSTIAGWGEGGGVSGLSTEPGMPIPVSTTLRAEGVDREATNTGGRAWGEGG
jgi:hypothetical protein